MTEKDGFDLQQFLPYLLNQAAETSGQAFQTVYKGRYGLLRTDWRVLFHIGIYDRLTAREIGLMAKVHKTKISRAVQRLQDRRYLLRETDAADRRREHLELTPSGRRVYEDLRRVAQDYERRLTAGFTAEEVAQLRRMLGRLAPVGPL